MKLGLLIMTLILKRWIIVFGKRSVIKAVILVFKSSQIIIEQITKNSVDTLLKSFLKD